MSTRGICAVVAVALIGVLLVRAVSTRFLSHEPGGVTEQRPLATETGRSPANGAARPGPDARLSAQPSPARRSQDDAEGGRELEEDADRLERDSEQLRRVGPGAPSSSGAPRRSDTDVEAIASSDFAPQRRDQFAGELARLRARFSDATSTDQRIAALSDFTLTHQLYVRYGGGLENLDFLKGIVAKEQSAELRRLAVIACHSLSRKEIVDALIDWQHSSHKEVRYYAAEGLAWVRGAESARAHGAMVAMLDDEEASVRTVTAVALAIVVKDPGDVPALSTRLTREVDPVVIEALKNAIQRLEQQSAAGGGPK
jgi:hypothetical protein